VDSGELAEDAEDPRCKDADQDGTLDLLECERNRVEDGFTDVGEREDDKNQTFDEDREQGDLL